jgi:hypothetical protein
MLSAVSTWFFIFLFLPCLLDELYRDIALFADDHGIVQNTSTA